VLNERDDVEKYVRTRQKNGFGKTSFLVFLTSTPSQGEPRDAGVNLDTYRIHAVSLSQHVRLVPYIISDRYTQYADFHDRAQNHGDQ